jgi:hypothetical protein
MPFFLASLPWVALALVVNARRVARRKQRNRLELKTHLLMQLMRSSSCQADPAEALVAAAIPWKQPRARG